MKTVFIDGSAGTTGLRIRERLAGRDDISLITLPDDLRKSESARSEAISSSSVTFLCLPDDAAREAVALCKNPETVIIDCSTMYCIVLCELGVFYGCFTIVIIDCSSRASLYALTAFVA